jgi:5-methyltetrahydropteroyltriglutamate--homocysteine methyltransferase
MVPSPQMEIRLANHSSYPRGPDSERTERCIIDEILHEQEAAGLDFVTDGQIGWRDPVSHLLAPLDGVRLGGRERLLDTDRTYLQPVIVAKLRHRAPILTPAYRLAALAARAPVKAVLTGPHTLANLCVIATTAYRSTAALAGDLSIILREEIASLVESGARLIQVDEPLILTRPSDIRLLRELLEPLHDACGERARLVVATYFADATPLYAQLNSLPADVIALDLAGYPALADAVFDTGAGKLLALGLLDGRSPQPESANAVARLLHRLLHRYVHDEVYVQPSCGLDRLERRHARAKLELLADVGRSFTAGAARANAETAPERPAPPAE